MDNNILNLFKELKKLDANLYLDDGTLKLNIKEGLMTQELATTIKQNKEQIIALLSSKKKADYIEIEKSEIKSSYPLSPAQSKLWLLSQMEAGSETYNMFNFFKLENDYDVESFKRAIWSVLERHEILRTVFREDAKGNVGQEIRALGDLNFEIGFEDYSENENPEESATAYVKQDSYAPFDLENGPLIRVCLLKLADAQYMLYYNMHHIICDGWSMNILARDIMAYYKHHTEGAQVELPDLQIQYKDFANWQLKELESPAYQTHKKYWLDKIAEDVLTLDLPSSKQRPLEKTFNGRQLGTILSKADATAIKNYVAEKEGTLFMFLLSSLKVLFYRYTSQEDIIVTSPVAGRGHLNLEDQIGYYINTIAIKSKLKNTLSFDAFYEQVKEDLMGAYAHQMYPFDLVVDELESANKQGRNGLFDVRVVLQNTVDNAADSEVIPERVGTVKDAGIIRAKFDLLFTFVEIGEHIAVDLIYNTDVYEQEMLSGFLTHYQQLIKEVLAESSRSIGTLDYLSEGDRSEWTNDWSSSQKDKSIVDLFAEQVRKSPAKTAVVFEEKALTYQELEEQSNLLAQELQQQYKLSAGDLVGMMMPVSEWSIVSILAILKSGAAYVPIDEAMPAQRVQHIIDSTQIKTLITLSSEEEKTKAFKVDRFMADQQWERLKEGNEKISLQQVGPKDLAYVIHTSGSTGIPKGVMITHSNLVDYTTGLLAHTEIASSHSFALMSNVATDLGNTVIYSALLTGGALHLLSKEKLRNAEDLHDYFNHHSIDCIKIVPTHWQVLSKEKVLLLPKRLIIFGGDSLPTSAVKAIYNQNPELEIINHYGPTETTIGKLLHQVVADKEYSLIPIGKPFSETKVYIVDQQLKRCPKGVAGELLIGGAGVASGYLNQAELTEKQFIRNPFSPQEEKLYRTGDLVRMLADGNIEFLGRIDNQVKIRGNRIELGAIESVLSKKEGIATVLVLAKEMEAGEKVLVAYYSGTKEIDTSEMRLFLEEHLPNYMVPSYFAFVEEFPLTANGKINRKVLPDPTITQKKVEEIQAPTNEKEQILLEVWSSVLKRDNISITDNFFDLGGDSIKSILIVSRLKKRGYLLKVYNILKTPVLSELATKLKEKAPKVAPPAAPESTPPSAIQSQPGESKPHYLTPSDLTYKNLDLAVLSELNKDNRIEDVYRLSPLQQGLYFHWVSDVENSAYAGQRSLRVKTSQITLSNIQKAYDLLVARHPILRTEFTTSNGELLQVVRKEVASTYIYEDFSKLEASEKESTVSAYRIKDHERGFALGQECLMRLTVLDLGEELYEFIWSSHHIIMDGWCTSILINEFYQILLSLEEGQPIALPPVVPYALYIKWLDNIDKTSSLNYWQKYLEDYDEKAPLPFKKTEVADQEYLPQQERTVLESKQLEQLKDLCQQLRITESTFMQVVWGYLLSKYNNTNDVVFGSVVSGRPGEVDGVEDMIGLFINTIPVRIKYSGEMSVLDLLKAQQAASIESLDHHYLSLAEVQGESELGNGLLDHVYLFQNYAVNELDSELLNAEGSQEKLSVVSFEMAGQTHYDFDLLVLPGNDQLEVIFNYDANVYAQESIVQIKDHLSNILSAFLEHPNQRLEEVSYLSKTEKSILVQDYNNTNVAYPKDKTIVDLFEAQVQKTPDNIALKLESESISYQSLNERANQLAHYLIKEGVGQESLIGICINRSVNMIVAILGVIKSGAAYVPIDPTYPEDRINYILKDSACKYVLTNQKSKAVLAEASNTQVISLDETAAAIKKQSSNNLSLEISPSNLLYVIYTSGTTGKPKGVLLEHENLVRLFVNEQALFDFNEKDVWTMFHSFCFDFSVWEMYGALLHGGRLVLISEETQKDTVSYANLLATEGVTILNQTPTAFNVLQEQALAEELSLKLRSVIFGGEALNPSRLMKWNQRYPDCQLINMYGITETTVHVTYKEITSVDIEKEKSNIGKPIPTLSCYVLDREGNLAPYGIVGELYVEGAGVARGYLNRPELTEERFIPNPFDDGKSRLYKTGDLAKWLPNGDLEYLGRIDDQVKIRGYRIELGEIENALLSHPSVNNGVVIKAPGEDHHLVAYYTSASALTSAPLRSYLEEKLPAYMVPSFFVALEEFPVTSNGKVNKKALPNPNALNLSSDVAYEVARNKQEEVLIAVWEVVLKREGIGINDSFYDLGGDSIKSIQVVSRLKQHGYVLQVSDLLRTPILSKLAKKLTRVTRKIDQSPVAGAALLTPIQHWFLSTDNYKDKSHFNQSVMLESVEALDLGLLEKSLKQLVDHHDALRMVFKEEDGQWSQENKSMDAKAYALEFHDLSKTTDYKSELETIADRLQASIKLEEGPLLKAGLFRLQDKDCLLLVIHHLVVDGVSWRIFLEDLGSIYDQLKKEEKMILPFKTDSFQRWGQMLSEYAKSEEMAEERNYWEDVLATSVASIKSRKESGSHETGKVKNAQFVLAKELVELLQTKVHRVYNTEINDVLLTGLGLGIQQSFGNNQVVLKLEGHGREEILEHLDITRTIGWFTSIFPFVLAVGDSTDFRKSLITVKESLRKLPNKGVGYGVLNYLGTGFKNELEQDIIFNYLGEFGNGTGTEKSSLLTFSEESTGKNSSALNDGLGDHLKITGMLVNGLLNINAEYNDLYFSEEKISTFLQNYQAALETIIRELSTSTQHYPTPSDLSYKGLSIAALSALNKNNNVEDVYRLSPLQEGIYYHWASSTDKSVYFCQSSFRLKITEVALANIRKSYQMLIDRHSILRTQFSTRHGDLLQIVYKEVTDTFVYEDIAGLAPKDQDLYVADYKLKDQELGFSLEENCLMRLAVIALGDGAYELVWSNHHILMDGWCTSILVNEFYQILISLEENTAITLPPVVPYSLYIQWLDKLNKKSSKLYWRQYLEGYTQKVELPFKALKAAEQSYLPKLEKISIESDQLVKFRKMCAQYKLTENTFMQTVWGYLLSRYNNTNDVVLGSVVSGRPGEIEGVEDMIGLFINTIPVRIQYSNDMSVTDLLKSQQEKSIASLDHHYLSLAEVNSESALGNEMFDHIYLFQNYAVNEMDTDLQGTEKLEQNFSIVSGQKIEQVHYDFDISVAPSKDALTVLFNYNGNVFDEKDIAQMGIHLGNVISAFLENPDQLLKEVSYLSASENTKLLREFNDTARPFPKGKTCLDLFEEIVAQTPDNSALVFEGKEISYQDLNEISNQFAHYLQAHYTIQANDFVGIKLERSDWTFVSMLAIWKSGGAYVPIDVNYPEERMDYIIQDSNCKAVIDEEELLQFQKVKSKYPGSTTAATASPDGLAYLIYTSGSTGRPKGVMVDHTNLVSRISYMIETYDFDEKDATFFYRSFSFDGSIEEYLLPVLSGAKCFIASRKFKENMMEEIIEHIENKQLTFFASLPALLSELVSYCIDHQLKINDSFLKHVVSGGDKLSESLAEQCLQVFPGAKLYNTYGPTECTIDSTHLVIAGKEELEAMTIGRPILNTEVYILDRNDQLQAPGITGEICIGGVGVAKGYLNRPELTAEKFVENPFRAGEKIYKTGDLGRWLSNGTIEFLGRIDDQVKIRGHRIELGEIERTLVLHESIDTTVVLAKDTPSGNKYLVAYYSAASSMEPAELHSFLEGLLPAFMIPGHFIFVEEFPLTSNGKIDRKQLKALEGEALVLKEHAAPRNALERELVEIWEEVLGMKGIGIQDNFFNSGGDSIISLRLVGKIRKKYQSNISIAQLYEFNTIEALAGIIEKSVQSYGEEQAIKEEILQEIEELKASVLSQLEHPHEIEDVYPMSDIQKGMIALSSLHPESRVYNNQSMSQIPKVDPQLFKQAFAILVEKHATLRTQFDLTNYSKPVQIVKKEMSFSIDHHDLQELDRNGKEAFIEKYMTEQGSRPYKVASEPLWRIGLFDINDQTSLFFFQEHHAILDGWSAASLQAELFQVYRDLEGKRTIKNTPLKASIKDAVIGELYDKRDKKAIEFWQTELAEYKKLDIFNNEVVNEALDFTYPFDFKYKLEQRCKEDGLTLRSAIYAAFAYALKMINYENDFMVGMVSHNRPAIEDADRIIGCFLNTIPMRNRLMETSNLSWLDYFQKMEADFARVKPFERLTLYEISKIAKEDTQGSSPFFEVIYNYTNFHIYDALELDTDTSFKESAKEEINVQPFAATNTALDFSVTLLGKSMALSYTLKKGLKNNLKLAQLHQYVEKIIHAYVDTPKQKIKDSLLLNEEELQVLRSFNKTEIAYPEGESVLSLLARQVAEHPNNIAIRYEGKQWSYQELDLQSNQLANYLKTTAGIEKNDFVAIQLERSEWMLISILGILKSGGAYIPLGMDYPAEKVAYIQTDSKFKACINESFIASFQEKMADTSSDALDLEREEKDMAYGIYTSGSTGKPKGAINAHAGLYNRLLWMRDDLEINEKDIILQKTPYTFDVSVWELLMPGIVGCSLVFAKPQGHKDPVYLQTLIKETKVSILHFVPSMLGMFLEQLDPSTCKSLRHIVCSGEALPGGMVEQAKAQLPWVRIHNLYGPTEAAIDVTSIDLTEVDTAELGVSIGKPVANTKIYIVDKELNLQPLGVPGELLIEGIQVAEGYLNRPELTAEKFLNSPFTKGDRLYRTGDLTKWLPNGEIAYLGRIDNQIKIRGNRVELGEIEQVLLAYSEDIKQTILKLKEGNGNPFLLAYYTTHNPVDKAKLKSYLTSKLPDYMVPSFFKELDQFPLLANGKVDRKLLPDIADDDIIRGHYVEPENEMQQAMIDIIKKQLGSGIAKVGITDNFFDLGLDSLSVLKVQMELNALLSLELKPLDFFQYPNVQSLTNNVLKVEEEEHQFSEEISEEMDDVLDFF